LKGSQWWKFCHETERDGKIKRKRFFREIIPKKNVKKKKKIFGKKELEKQLFSIV